MGIHDIPTTARKPRLKPCGNSPALRTRRMVEGTAPPTRRNVPPPQKPRINAGARRASLHNRLAQPLTPRGRCRNNYTTHNKIFCVICVICVAGLASRLLSSTATTRSECNSTRRWRKEILARQSRASLGSSKNRRVYLRWPDFWEKLKKVPPNPLQRVTTLFSSTFLFIDVVEYLTRFG